MPRAVGREDRRWWKQTQPDALADVLSATLTSIEARQKPRRRIFAKHASLYLDLENQESTSLLSQLSTSNETQGRVSRNVCHALVQTCMAHIAKNRPRPMFLTRKGDNALQKKAKDLTAFIDGLYAQMKIHRTGQMVFRDAAIFATGFGHFYADADRGEIVCERVPVDEIFVDDREARYGSPRQMFRVRAINRDVLIDMFPDCEADLLVAPTAPGGGEDSDMLQVIEAWHLPTGRVKWRNEAGEEQKERGKGLKPETDGKHVLVCGKTVLSERPWTHDWFPILPFHWEEPLFGFWGRGLVESVAGKQLELNNLDRDIQTTHEMMGRPVILLPIGANIDIDDINNEIGAVIRYDGAQPPGFQRSPTLDPAIYQERAALWQQCFEDTGVSHSNATGQKPAGVEAAVAIREVNDLSGTRFVVKAQAYESWFLDGAAICIALARELYDEHDIDLVAKGRAGKFIRNIKWSDVDMDDDAFDMQMFPTSLLPTTPAGRLQTVTELMQGGLLSPEEGRQLMDFPDLDGARGMTLATEAFEYAVDLVGDVLEGREPNADPRVNLDLTMKVVLSSYLRALRDGTPETTLERLRQLMDTLQRWQDLIKGGLSPADVAAGATELPPPPMPPPGAGGPMPMGPEGGPPMPMPGGPMGPEGMLPAA